MPHHRFAPKESLKTLAAAWATTGTATAWAAIAGLTLAIFRKAMAISAVGLPDREDGLLTELKPVITLRIE